LPVGKFMVPPPKDAQFSAEEMARRRDAVVRRMLNTPPKPHSEMKIGKHRAKRSKRPRQIAKS
jgi:hypothetical protein